VEFAYSGGVLGSLKVVPASRLPDVAWLGPAQAYSTRAKIAAQHGYKPDQVLL
jgi:hypothetical protein